ncbi:MAG: heme-binding protein, partial [Candidatus Competibacteraceae bacterium]|nr:heme-binding protein [Candidatus Competibacteraceae bacterium]
MLLKACLSAIGSIMIWAPIATAQEATFQYTALTPETALTAAQAALQNCREAGYQVAVAVV